MAESIVQLPAPTVKMHTWNRTIGVNSIEDEFVNPGEFPYATYSVIASGISTATAASHMLQIMAGASLNLRIRRILMRQSGAPAAVASLAIQIFRLTTAGTGGTAITARPYDSADAAAGAAGMTLPTVKGTEGVQLWEEPIWLGTGAIPITAPLEWRQSANGKPLIIPAGTTNGIAIKNSAAVAAATITIMVELVETNFV